jgi:hypothetical protein
MRVPSAFMQVLACGLFFAAPVHADVCSEADISISAPPLSGSDHRAFVAKFRSALTRVCTWWGSDYPGPYNIDIEDSRGTSMALIPAWRGKRGQVIFRMRTIRQTNSPITHEIVHVLATNANRFLAEGLAVHTHDALNGQPAFPNFGRDLHDRAVTYASKADLAALERLPVPRRLELPGLAPQGAYMVAGSFVRFLIETRGMDKFRTLYEQTPLEVRSRFAGDVNRWQAVYGVPLETLAMEWRQAITR